MEPSTVSISSALDLSVPRNLTALLQHLQRLVGREDHRYWCGGTIPATKLVSFSHKMSTRYPLLRNTRERSYDRQRGRAVVHMILYPIDNTLCAQYRTSVIHDASTTSLQQVAAGDHVDNGPVASNFAWWLVSGPGSGGLSDPATPDAHVARDAMSKDGHIIVGDYVLLYATKKDPRKILDARTGRSQRIFKEISTWTWKMRNEIFQQVRASVDECCDSLAYGTEPTQGHGGWGLRGLLAAQRTRPLFSGVRNQVVDLHKYAFDSWEGRRSLWLAAHPEDVRKYGPDAGTLWPITEILAQHLPKMMRLPVYDNPPHRVRDLLRVPS